MMSDKAQGADSRVETIRRISVGVAWGLVPVLFAGWLATNVEGPMPAGAQAVALLQRVMMLALGSAVVFISGLFGMRVLRWARIAPESLFARFLLGAGVGLGAISLLTLGFGCAGLLGAPFSAGLLGAMFLAGISELRAFGDFLRGEARKKIAPLSFFELLLVFIVLVVLVFQLVLAFNLPTDYDACEYHMAAPWRWAQLGRIDYVEGNVFTNMPMNCEMLYLFGFGLCGGWMPGSASGPVAKLVPAVGPQEALYLGVHLGVVMNLMTAVLAAAAAYVLARRFFSRRAALAGATLFFTMPWTMVASTINIYNEMLLAFYATVAVYAFLELAETRLVRWLVLSAVFAGLAAGVKYTALGFFVPVGAVAAAVAFSTSPFKGEGRVRVKTLRREGASGDGKASTLTLPSPCKGEVETAGGGAGAASGILKRLGAGALYSAIVLLVVSPWLAKNVAYTGNPTYPFFYKWFGGRDWSDDLDAKWYQGNMKAAGADKAGNLLWAVGDRVIANKWGSLAMAVLAALSLGAWGERRVRWLLAFLVLWTLFWYFGTHRVDRFWLPFAGVAAALAGCGFDLGIFRREPLRWALSALLVVALGWQVYVNSLIFAYNAAGNYDLKTGNMDFLGRRHDLAPILPCRPDRDLAWGSFYFIGEARTLYFLMADENEVRCNTVFDRQELARALGAEKDPAKAGRALKASGAEYLFVNWGEVGRLRESYACVGRDGRLVPGFPALSPGDIARLQDAGYLAYVHVPDVQRGERFPVGGFSRAHGKLRGLSEEDVQLLPEGRTAALYRVWREPLPRP